MGISFQSRSDSFTACSVKHFKTSAHFRYTQWPISSQLRAPYLWTTSYCENSAGTLSPQGGQQALQQGEREPNTYLNTELSKGNEAKSNHLFVVVVCLLITPALQDSESDAYDWSAHSTWLSATRGNGFCHTALSPIFFIKAKVALSRPEKQKLIIRAVQLKWWSFLRLQLR